MKIRKDINKYKNKHILLMILEPFIPIYLPKNKQIKKLTNGKYKISKYIKN